MTEKMDMWRVANSFLEGAKNGHTDLCHNVIANYAHVYRKPYKDVLSTISVMLMDPTGYSSEEWIKVKRMILKMKEY